MQTVGKEKSISLSEEKLLQLGMLSLEGDWENNKEDEDVKELLNKALKVKPQQIILGIPIGLGDYDKLVNWCFNEHF